MKDLSPLATGNHFQATRRDLLLNDRKVSSSSWHSLVRLGRSTWLIAQQNSCLANDSTYASGIYTLYLEVWCESLKLFIPPGISFFTLTVRAPPKKNREGELLSPRSPGPQKRLEFSVFLADVRPSSGSKKLSLGAAQTFSGYEEAGVHHIEENPTRLCMYAKSLDRRNRFSRG